MRKLSPTTLTVALVVAMSFALPALAQDADGPILFINVTVFDGVNAALIENANVVVTDNLITAVSTEPLAIAGGTVIDGGGRTLMPGLIDTHQHLNQGGLSLADQFVAALTIGGGLQSRWVCLSEVSPTALPWVFGPHAAAASRLGIRIKVTMVEPRSCR